LKDSVIKSGIRNTMYVIFAQLLNLVFGITKGLILPIILGVSNFGYWQVYVLYSAYLGVFSFGFNDGIYLIYSKYNYDELPKPLFRSSIRLFLLMQFIITGLLFLLLIFEKDLNKKSALTWTIINIPIIGLTGVLTYILQITNQVKKYSVFITVDKILILVFIYIILLFKSDNYLIVIIADTMSRFLVLILLAYSCRDIILGKGIIYKKVFSEFVIIVQAGLKLMFSNLIGMIILGLGRIIVERFESIQNYAYYSFAISTTGIVLNFINAVGLVIYPTFSRMDESKHNKYMVYLNEIICIIIYALLILYFPIVYIVNTVLIEYKSILIYLPFIFGTIFVQAKMQIIVNLYYKLLRLEKSMLKANINGLILAVIMIIPSYIAYRSVLSIAVSTLLAMIIRLYISELEIKRYLGIKNYSMMILELLYLTIFIILAYNFSINSLVIYILLYITYCIAKKQVIIIFYNIVKGKM